MVSWPTNFMLTLLIVFLGLSLQFWSKKLHELDMGNRVPFVRMTDVSIRVKDAHWKRITK